jgi:hypothetical protein
MGLERPRRWALEGAGGGCRTRRRLLPGCGDGVPGVEAEAVVGVVVSGAAARPRRWSSSSSRSEAQSSMRVGSRRSIVRPGDRSTPSKGPPRHAAARREGSICREGDLPSGGKWNIGWTGPDQTYRIGP